MNTCREWKTSRYLVLTSKIYEHMQRMENFKIFGANKQNL